MMIELDFLHFSECPITMSQKICMNYISKSVGGKSSAFRLKASLFYSKFHLNYSNKPMTLRTHQIPNT